MFRNRTFVGSQISNWFGSEPITRPQPFRSLFSDLSDGSLVVSTSDNTLNSYYSISSQANAGSSSITLSSSSGLVVGDKVMIYQSSHSTNFGLWEVSRITGISGNTISLNKNLLNTYYVGGTTSGSSQVIRIPEYNSLTVNSGGSIISPAWNGSTGGVVVLCASEIILNSGGTISSSSKGYRFFNISTGSSPGVFVTGNQGETYSYTPYGNQSTSAFNGAGGGGAGGAGNYGNAGGGGGAAHRNNGTAGGTSDPNGAGGGGGTAYGTTDLYTRITFGTGGSGGGTHDTGAGRSGGNGGGIVILMSDTMSFNGGTINCSGGNTSQSYGNYTGGSSGGSGGSIAIFNTGSTGSATSINIGPGSASSGTGWAPGGAGSSSQGRYAIYTTLSSAPTLSSSQTLDVASGNFSYTNTKLLA